MQRRVAVPQGDRLGADEAALARVREMAEKLLANTVIEEFRVRVEA